MNWEYLITVYGSAGVSLLLIAGGIHHRVKTFPQELSAKASKETVDNLQNQFNSFQNTLNIAFFNQMAQKGSPLQLTPYAKQVLSDLKFEEVIFPKIKDILVQELEKYTLRTPYDVQEKAQLVIRQKREDPLYDEMKKAIYRTGNNLDEVLAAIWIPLRDYYLKKHPEIIN